MAWLRVRPCRYALKKQSQTHFRLRGFTLQVERRRAAFPLAAWPKRNNCFRTIELGEIDTLERHLKPIKSEARIYELLGKGFCGRQWLPEAVVEWGQDEKRDSHLFWIMGAPGVGKSAFAAQLTHTRSDAVIAAQFVEWDEPDHRDARPVVRSLAFQLASRLPDSRKLLGNLPEIAELEQKSTSVLFDYLLADPLKLCIGGRRQRYLIVIDAQNEARESGSNPLLEMLARHVQRLPEWHGLVVTSRPDFDTRAPVQALNPVLLDTESEFNRADIRGYGSSI